MIFGIYYILLTVSFRFFSIIMPELNMIFFVSSGWLNKKKGQESLFTTFWRLLRWIKQYLKFSLFFRFQAFFCANKSVITSRNCRTVVFSSFPTLYINLGNHLLFSKVHFALRPTKLCACQIVHGKSAVLVFFSVPPPLSLSLSRSQSVSSHTSCRIRIDRSISIIAWDEPCGLFRDIIVF